MSLILTLLSYKGGPPLEAITFTLDTAGGSLGRSSENRFVLPDPEKFVSRKHASFSYRDGAYYYTDTSTAGTYFVNRNFLLQHDSIPLSEGDVLRIGEYEFGVTRAPQPGQGTERQEPEPFGFDFFSAEPAPPAPEPAWSEPMADWQPEPQPAHPVRPPETFSAPLPPLPEPAWSAPAAADWQPEPPAAPASVPEPASVWSEPVGADWRQAPEPVLSSEPQAPTLMGGFGLSGAPGPTAPASPPAGSSFIGQADVSPFHESFTPPAPVSPGADQAPPGDFDLSDLLADLDLQEPAVAKTPAPDQSGWELPDDFFKDLAPVESQPVQPATPTADFFEPGFGISGAGAPPGGAGAEIFPFAESVSEAPPPHTPVPSAAQVTPRAGSEPVFVPPVEVMAPAAVQPGLPSAMPPPGFAPEPVTAPLPAGVPPSAPSLPPSPPDSGQLVECFLRGAGLDSREWIAHEDLPQLMETAGGLFRDLVEGLMTVLRARSEMKSQFRVAVTTMRASGNNPLKFATNVEDTLKVMLAREHTGFLAPAQAVQEGFADLMNHQMAMTAGIQASLASALKRFDPARLEKLCESSLVFQKGKCWDAYCKAYPELVNEIVENFFGEEFAEVYERQMRILQATKTS